MKDVGGGCQRALDMVGGLLDLEDRLEDVQKSGEESASCPFFEFAVLAEGFFCTKHCTSPPASQGVAVHVHTTG